LFECLKFLEEESTRTDKLCCIPPVFDKQRTGFVHSPLIRTCGPASGKRRNREPSGNRAPDGIRRWQTTGVPNAGVTRYKGWPRPQTGFTPQVRVYSRAAREKWIQFRNIPDNASPLEYVASLKKLAALDWDRMIPGHPYAGGRYGPHTARTISDANRMLSIGITLVSSSIRGW